jgi:hypothetical protein
MCYTFSKSKEKYMPIIARFYGIVIKMYFSQSDHGIPHFHAILCWSEACDTLNAKAPRSQGANLVIQEPL